MLHPASEVIIQICRSFNKYKDWWSFLTYIFANIKALNISGRIAFGFLMSDFRLDLIFTDVLKLIKKYFFFT